jgi:hypothetical protein
MNRWLFSLACLSLFFPSPLQADGQPRPSEIAPGGALPFRLSSGYHIQVEGRIGDQAHLKFILDTGAPISIGWGAFPSLQPFTASTTPPNISEAIFPKEGSS